ncbi:DUF3322 and DUF2220 domain-containing protein [Propionibacterium australiense]|uniref:DUF3322 and DUF2220 domain-containing protein n=1 Tax=Propionibacterium australiense TaxID=119981 RepID=A0A383S786_9ACTN|nr:DUF3322 and DUF2220 domain-containing protein [Propionibacterium australiense]RLP09674.1 DUF3322 and DUF2220 domain-containing protein [Propionibacterium australiense]RLP12376.1 DUF3322 and DUF2220 domain-containing protein [Propionibacterium australiense]SYZ33581.1 Uncharacterized protein conserved in bacteria C-term(DUF2220) [Propionibacterium australiense]VEH89531.1 Uncharacterized protein conserved in bacteria [Propionibacterium australiense]
MKTPDQVTADIRRRLTKGWHTHLTGEEAAFPHDFPLGRTDAAQLRGNYAAVHALTVDWQQWARRHDVQLTYATRMATGGTRQQVPTHAQVAGIDHAAAIVGDGWPERLERGRRRLNALKDGYPQLVDLARTVRAVDGYSDLDFDLLRTVADWFADDPLRAHGVTPRQVPIPGVHAKWLQAHEATVCALIGIHDLHLAPRHPSRIHFTYLDPDHIAGEGRVHDSATVGDRFTPAYRPRVVIISENKDTAIYFPAMPGAISVEGMGRGGKAAASFEWLHQAPLVVYWGDIDRDGYEILDGYRADFGRDIESVLMDEAAYTTYERFGTDTDRHGAALRPGNPRPVPRLRASERAVYTLLTDPSHDGHRRVEQERIPLHVALEHVLGLDGMG